MNVCKRVLIQMHMHSLTGPRSPAYPSLCDTLLAEGLSQCYLQCHEMLLLHSRAHLDRQMCNLSGKHKLHSP